MYGTYIGHNKEVSGRTACIRPHKIKGVVEAKFDDLDLPIKHTHNWKRYPERCFILDQEDIV